MRVFAHITDEFQSANRRELNSFRNAASAQVVVLNMVVPCGSKIAKIANKSRGKTILYLSKLIYNPPREGRFYSLRRRHSIHSETQESYSVGGRLEYPHHPVTSYLELHCALIKRVCEFDLRTVVVNNGRNSSKDVSTEQATTQI